MNPAEILQPNFKKRQSYKFVRDGVYLDPRSSPDNPRYVERPTIDGRRTWRPLDARKINEAIKELRARRTDQARAKHGLARDPYKPISQESALATIAEFYLKAGCPKRRAGKRTEQTHREETTRVGTLLKWWHKKTIADVTPENLRRYHAWRVERLQHANATGDRQVDKEIITLSNIFRWAVLNQSRTGITSNPLRESRITFTDARQVRHCRDHMPSNGEELHAIARYLLLAGPRTVVLGWLHLFQAMIGQRIAELLRLRLDAPHEQPGHIGRTKAGKIGTHLYLYRSESSKGTFPYAEIHPDLRECLEAFLNWHAQTHPDSPWYFPSPENPAQPVSPSALTHALRRICPTIGIPHRTSHGNRSYFVNVLRGQGKPDGEIALRIGQRTGGSLIVQVYGEILPYKLAWRPESGAPAWQPWSTTAQLPLEL